MMASGTGNSGEISFKILGVGGGPAFEQNVTLELPHSAASAGHLTGSHAQIKGLCAMNCAAEALGGGVSQPGVTPV